MSSIHSKFRQHNIQNLMDSMVSPVVSITIAAGGANYVNAAAMTFSGGTPVGSNTANGFAIAISNVVTNTALYSAGMYYNAPTVIVAGGNTLAALTPNLDNDKYYVYEAGPSPFADEAQPDPNYDNEYDGFLNPHRQMMFGKRLTPADIAFVVTKNLWTEGTVYAEYDDKDQLLSTKAFYVVTATRDVFKCIFNNNGAPSTATPTTTSTGVETYLDGYRWKYLYTYDTTANTNFNTTNFMPALSNSAIVAAAVDGSIENIKVLTGGSNYPTDSGTIIAANTTTGVITISTTSSDVVNYYANCTITVANGASAYHNFKIVSSSVAGSVKTLNVGAGAFVAGNVAPTFLYTIGPTLNLETADGTGLVAYSVVSANTNALVSVEVVAPGSGYHIADMTVEAGSGFGSGATVRPVISPKGGHGAALVQELFAEHVGISALFPKTTYPSATVYFRSFGILKNPSANTSSVAGSYVADTFNACSNLAVTSVGSSNYFAPGEVVSGSNSRASGIVVTSNTTVTLLSGVIGNLSAGEVLKSTTGPVVQTLTAITNGPAIKIFVGDILYADNVVAVNRASSTTGEQVKLILKF